MAGLEMSIGDYNASLKIRHEMVDSAPDESRRMTNILILTAVYARLGDLKRAGDYPQPAEDLFATRHRTLETEPGHPHSPAEPGSAA
jgi:hypothetical protein